MVYCYNITLREASIVLLRVCLCVRVSVCVWTGDCYHVGIKSQVDATLWGLCTFVGNPYGEFTHMYPYGETHKYRF